MKFIHKTAVAALSTLILMSCETREELDTSISVLISSIDQAEEDAMVHSESVKSLYEKIERSKAQNWWSLVSGCRGCEYSSSDSLQARNILRLDLEQDLRNEERELADAQAKLREVCQQLIDKTEELERRLGEQTSIPKACEL
ncbi:hypothetical protein [Alloyangia pacifica]|uniref:hypothetical protein n=1 Tax=Alloyangia pacifica TaxID=311180 RepID=UPI00115FD04C|nr:hypothetical protein [Alloyangia pacifica]